MSLLFKSVLPICCGSINESQDMFARAANQNPASLPMVQSYSAFLIAQNRPAEAQSLFERAIKAAAKDSNLRVLYAGFLKTQQKANDAEKQLKAAVDLSAANPYAHHDLANLYLEQKKIAASEKELELAAKADPRFPATPKLLGQIRLAQKRYSEAVEQLEKARSLAIDPAQIQEIEEALDMARRGLTSERLDRARAARPADTWATYAQSLRQNPGNAGCIVIRMKLLLSTKRSRLQCLKVISDAKGLNVNP